MRLGMVGCGAVALEQHLPAMHAIQGLELVAVVDKDLAWTEQVARDFGARYALTDYQDLEGKIDAAVVATPNWSHVEITSYLLDHGIHVLCEKPLGLTTADARHVFATADRNRTRVMAAHSRRFTASAQTLRTLVQLGSFGRLEHLGAAMGGPLDRWPSRSPFRTDPRLSGGGCLMDTGIHLIDLAVWLVGGGEARVDGYVSGQVLGWGVEDDAALTLGLGGGVIAQLACSYTRELNFLLHLDGSNGWARMPLNGAPGAEFMAGATVLGRRGGVQQVPVLAEPTHLRQLRHFADCVRSEEPFIVRPDEVLEVLRIIETCYRIGADSAA